MRTFQFEEIFPNDEIIVDNKIEKSCCQKPVLFATKTRPQKMVPEPQPDMNFDY